MPDRNGKTKSFCYSHSVRTRARKHTQTHVRAHMTNKHILNTHLVGILQ